MALKAQDIFACDLEFIACCKVAGRRLQDGVDAGLSLEEAFIELSRLASTDPALSERERTGCLLGLGTAYMTSSGLAKLLRRWTKPEHGRPSAYKFPRGRGRAEQN